MAEINGIDLAHMPNGAHYLFALDVLNKAKANENVAERAAAAVAVLEKKVAAEDEALKLTRKSLKTDEIKTLDDTRAETDTAYRNLVKRVNALWIVEYDEAYDEFINYVNTEIKHYKEEVLSSSSSKKKATTTTTSGDDKK